MNKKNNTLYLCINRDVERISGTSVSYLYGPNTCCMEIGDRLQNEYDRIILH